MLSNTPTSQIIPALGTQAASVSLAQTLQAGWAPTAVPAQGHSDLAGAGSPCSPQHLLQAWQSRGEQAGERWAVRGGQPPVPIVLVPTHPQWLWVQWQVPGLSPSGGTGVQRAAGCLYHILGWHETSGLGRTRSSPGTAHGSPRTHTQPCTRRTLSAHGAASVARAWPAPREASTQRGRTDTHRAVHTPTAECKHTHAHLHANTPPCKRRLGHTCLLSAPPAPCSPHANPPAPCKSPARGPRQPRGMQMAIWGPVGWGTARGDTASPAPWHLPARHSLGCGTGAGEGA